MEVNTGKYEVETEIRKPHSLGFLCSTPESVEENKRVFVTHMTDANNLIKIASKGGLLIDPTSEAHADKGTCSELFTHPLVVQKNTHSLGRGAGIDKGNHVTIQSRRAPRKPDGIPNEGYSLFSMDTERLYSILKSSFPELYNYIMSQLNSLANKWPQYYAFSLETYTFETTSVREFSLNQELEDAKYATDQTVNKISAEILKIYTKLLK